MKTLVRNYDPSWELLRKLEALSEDTSTKEELYILTQRGILEVWYNDDFTIAMYPESGALNILSILGAEVIVVLEDLSVWVQVHAKELRCTKVQLLGRRAWVRLLKNCGYKETAVMLECEVK